MQISKDLKQKLISLADKYETSAFMSEDPSQFLHHYKDARDVELCAFVASMISFGSRKQFIPKINFLVSLADEVGGFYNWITKRHFEKNFTSNNEQKFYRFYSYKDFYQLFDALFKILLQDVSLGAFFNKKYLDDAQKQDLIDLIPEYFTNTKIVPQTKNSAKKRLCMFLRWLVRTNSSVDLGLWTWYPKERLLIPLDVHVLKMAKELNLIEQNALATRKSAEHLTQIAKQIFADDPSRLDFALFGLGVDES